MSKALTIGAFAAGCGVAYLIAARRPAPAHTGRTHMEPNVDEQFKVTLAEFAAEKDAQKKATLRAKLDAEIAARKAREAAAAAAPKPLYPVGLEVRFGTRQATVTAAHQDGQGAWHYTIALRAGEFLGLGDGDYQKSEAEMRRIIADEVKQPLAADQAFPQGIAVYRNGQGGVVARVDKVVNDWTYYIQGWPNAVTQAQLLAILRK